ncbi:MAG: DUF2231 domain-containing protein [Pseudohongiella sp.]|nr:DUF2231 domain-containing protein [Pseudohongiella sp.]MDO9521017.1 DUF2231 domain-containing protein [Pseudohongiella sp.]MDP2128951.1 DUF2231 domain-containing protein [Pseudohongiella sp.]
MPAKATLRPIGSKITMFGHPLHPAMIHFPVAALFGLVATDLAYLLTSDYFWARAGLWLSGVGALGGALSGCAGLADLILVRQIRRVITAWCHGILAVMLLSLASLNWLLRFSAGADTAILPWGLYLSLLSGLLIGVTGFLGAQLVYEYAVGVDLEEAAGNRPDI